MLEIKFNLVCDNCKKEKEYTKDNKEKFVISLVQDGWFIENKKHFCSKSCKDKYNENK